MKPPVNWFRTILVAVALLPWREATAQDPVIASGTLARVSFYDVNRHKRSVVGPVVEMGRDSIVLGQPRRVFTSGQIARVDVSTGKRRRPVAGLFLGALGGAIVGTVIGITASGDGNIGGTPASALGAAAGFLGGVVVGAPVGLGIGSFKIYNRWETVRP